MITLIKALKKYTSASDPVFFFNNMVGDLDSNFRTIETNINTLTLNSLITYTTANRPDAKNVTVGSCFFNTTTNIPNFSDGTNWRNAAGTIV
jgi:hypothetical protein